MKKKLLCLMVAIVMSLQCGTIAFAVNPKHFDYVDTTAVIQIAQNKEPGMVEITDATGSSVTVDKTASEAFPKFDYLCTLDMKNVRDKLDFYYDSWDSLTDYSGVDDSAKNEINARIENMKVTGEITVEIKYPKSMVIPEEFLKSGEMIGFDENAKLIFGKDVRSVVEGSTDNTLKIVVNIVGEAAEGRPDYVLAKQLKENVDRYLSDFTLSCENVGTTQYGTFNVSGKITGFTLAEETGNDRPFLKVDYKTNPEKAIATCTVKKASSSDSDSGSSGSGGGGASQTTTEYKVSFDVDGDMQLISPVTKKKNEKLKSDELKVPNKDGYAFDGWYTDKEFKNKVVGDIDVSKNITLYAKWIKETDAVEWINSFVDVKSDDWFYESVRYANVNGLFNGTSEDKFSPNEDLTRAMLVTVLYRAEGEPETNAALKFKDVSKNAYYANAVLWAQENGIISGVSDDEFAPDVKITREQIATIIYRYAVYKGIDTITLEENLGFKDAGDISEYAVSAMNWIAGQEIIKGYEDNTVKPRNNATRAEATAILQRFLEKLKSMEKN